jgi:prolyl oligopeptidase
MRCLFALAAALCAASCSMTPPPPASPAAAEARPAAAGPAATAPPDDPYLWLEDVQGDQALAWVRERNARSQAVLTGQAAYAPLRERLLAILNSRDRIPYVRRQGAHLYNLWQDATNKRGLWRRTTLDEYRKPAPAWETVLDIDALGAAEKTNWVFGGATCHAPESRRCLLQLSRGGADATVVREFDTVAKQFIPGGFELPEAKTDVTWADENTIYVGSDFGPGSLTESGYPRVIKRWRRGTPLAAAETVFEGLKEDVAVSVEVDRTPGYERTWFSRALDFYRTQVQLLQNGKLVPVPKPDDATLSFHREWALLDLRSDLSIGGQRFPSGSLLITPADDLLRGQPRYTALFTPTATASLAGYGWTRSRLLLTIADNVVSRVEELQLRDGGWQRRAVQAPSPGTLSVTPLHSPLMADDPLAENYLINYADFLTPDSLMLGRAGSDERELLKQRPRQFDGTGMRAEQRFARSADGTRVPYFVIRPQGAKEGERRPTLLYGYGGFEVSMQPWYSAAFGTGWLQRGGVVVVANLRGGGEFGPAWHQAAVKADKQKSYDDFIAVAQALVAQGITTPAQLGIMGGSNGGLLVGAVFTQRPELFGAVVCQVPLLDMRRYTKLLAGASWMAEYGDPDKPAEWAWISKYSPYQVVKPGVHYPRVLFTTSTRDDRVHPGHARKMVARMQAQGHEVLYYENIEGGHGGAADNEQRAHLQALEYTFLWSTLSNAPGTASPASGGGGPAGGAATPEARRPPG